MNQRQRTDHLGSTRLTYRADLATSELASYTVWGVASGAFTNTRYTYTGQYSYTATFGLIYYNARWYDPTLKRFAQPDSIVPNPGNPMSWDRYAYVLNNPLKYRDPSGHNEDCGMGDSSCKVSYVKREPTPTPTATSTSTPAATATPAPYSTEAPKHDSNLDEIPEQIWDTVTALPFEVVPEGFAILGDLGIPFIEDLQLNLTWQQRIERLGHRAGQVVIVSAVNVFVFGPWFLAALATPAAPAAAPAVFGVALITNVVIGIALEEYNQHELFPSRGLMPLQEN